MRHVLNYGMGTDSTALLLRWLYEPETRPCDLSELVVVSAMTGNEWPQTGELVAAHMLPLMREHGVRYVQLARSARTKTEAGDAFVAVLDDSRQPERVYLEGAYKLSDEMTSAGTVPQCGGTRKCSMHAKGDPIDAWLEHETGGERFTQYMGFEVNELSRAVKDARDGDSDVRAGAYPLVEWGWDRDACDAYILARTGARWIKSACTYCPFALQTKAGQARVLPLFIAAPRAGTEALMIEHLSVSLNERQGLIKDKRLVDLLASTGQHGAVLAAFEAKLAACEWRVYEVRRVTKPNADPARPGNTARSVRSIAAGTRDEMLADLASLAADHGIEAEAPDGIQRVRLVSRAETSGAWEHFYVAAPAGADDKAGPAFPGYWASRLSYQEVAARRE